MWQSAHQEAAEGCLDADGGPLLPDGHEVLGRRAGDGGEGGGEHLGRGGGHRGGVVGGLGRRGPVAAASGAAPQGAVVAGGAPPQLPLPALVGAASIHRGNLQLVLQKQKRNKKKRVTSRDIMTGTI